MKNSMKTNGFLLTAFAIASTALVSVTHLLTKDRIAQQVESDMQRMLDEVIPPANYDNDLFEDCILVNDIKLLGRDEDLAIYRAKQGENYTAAVLNTTAPDGYNGKIDSIVAIAQDGTIIGVRVVQHNETPGLGDKVELRRSDWITSFNGTKLNGANDPAFAVTKDGGKFDQFTGATITPRAVVKSVKNASLYFYEHKQEIFASVDTNCHGKPVMKASEAIQPGEESSETAMSQSSSEATDSTATEDKSSQTKKRSGGSNE